MNTTKKSFLIGGLAALALAGCGSHSVSAQNKQEAQAQYAKAQKVLEHCLPQKDGAPDPLVLRSKSARVSFENCAVPVNQRVNFRKCIASGLLSGFPTKKHLEATAEKCVNEVK